MYQPFVDHVRYTGINSDLYCGDSGLERLFHEGNMDIILDITAIVASMIALFTLVLGVIEYARQGAVKRVDHFIEMRHRFKSNEKFRTIAELIEEDDETLRKIPYGDKRDFLGFFEEIALSLNSGLIHKQVVHYMFGYYAIRCWESSNFWCDLNRNSNYWQLFRDFVDQMKEVELNFKFKRKNFKL